MLLRIVWVVSMIVSMVIGHRRRVAPGWFGALGGLMAGFFFGPLGVVLVLVSSRREGARPAGTETLLS